MPEEALVTGQVGQPAPQEPQSVNVTGNGATIQQNGSGAPESEQPLSLTQSQLSKMISDALAAEKQNWLNEAYQNTQSMNDKFEKRVNDTIAAFEKAGIKTDKVSAAKYLREQDRQANANAQKQPQIDPAYQQFLSRFGSQSASDPRLQGAFSLEREYGIQLMKDDPEFSEYFGDPNKRFDTYHFQRDYEDALKKKKERMAEASQGNIAGLPSMSGTGKKADRITNKMSSQDIYDMALAEQRNKMR